MNTPERIVKALEDAQVAAHMRHQREERAIDNVERMVQLELITEDTAIDLLSQDPIGKTPLSKIKMRS